MTDLGCPSARRPRRGARLSPEDATLRGRIGAYETHARHDVRLTTANARATFLASFAAAVDPDRTLSPAERERRARAAIRAHLARLAYRRWKSARNGGGAEGGEVAS